MRRRATSPHDALVPAARMGRAGPARVARRRRAGAGRGAPRGRRPARSRAISFGSQLDGLVAADAAGEPVRAGADLDGPARRRRVRRGRARGSTRPGCARSPAATSIPGHVAREDRVARARTEPEPSTRPRAGSCCRARSSPGARPASSAVDPSNASSTMLLDVAHAAAGRTRRAPRSASTRRRSRRCGRADAVLGPVAPWLREAAGLDGATLVVLGCGDEMAATLGAGVVDPGAVCDVMGTAEPVCAVVAGPALDPDGRRRAASARRSRRRGCSRTRAGSRAAPTAGSATSWAAAEVDAGGGAPAPTCTSC